MSYPLSSGEPLTPASIDRVYEPQHGGFVKFEYVPVEDVQTFGGSDGVYRTDGKVDGITLKSGKSWLQAKVPPGRRGLTQVQRDGDGGAYIDISADVFVPFYNYNNDRMLNRLKYHRFICKATYKGGYVLVIGNLQNPARLSFDKDGGANFKSIPGAAVRFSWLHEDSCPQLHIP